MRAKSTDPLLLIGKTFNELTIRSIFRHPNHYPGGGFKNEIWCKCDCSCGVIGHEAVVSSVVRGNAKSCGHLRDDSIRQRSKTHGKTKSTTDPKIHTARGVFTKFYKDGGTLTFEQFLELSQQRCIYCDAAPSNTMHCTNNQVSEEYLRLSYITYSGLDRLHNERTPEGKRIHNFEDVAPACGPCNKFKGEQPIEEFLPRIIRAHTLNTNGRQPIVFPPMNELNQHMVDFGLRLPNGKQTKDGSQTRHRFGHYVRSGADDFLFDHAFYLAMQPCYFCGALAKDSMNRILFYDARKLHYNGIDRLDNGIKQYTLTNSYPCCIECNFGKEKLLLPVFENLIDRIYTNILYSPFLQDYL